MFDPTLGYGMATALLVLFALFGAFDGVYFHMIKYRLHEHPPAQLEHQIHTFRGLLFIPIALIFFAWNSAGLLLWAGLGLLLIDLIAEVVDILVEKKAREGLGGISSAESVIHVTATGFRMGALAIVLAMKPLSAFMLTTDTAALAPLPDFLSMTGWAFAIGVMIALLFQALLVLWEAPFTLKMRSQLPSFRICCTCQSQNGVM